MTERIERYSGEYAGLASTFQVNPDSCGNHNHYEEYIKFCAITDNIDGLGTTHVFIRELDSGEQELLGYITLRATSYIEEIEGRLHGSPAMEIFELAVSHSAERQGIGSALVKFALASAMDINMESIGIRYITLCADEKAVPFYEKFKFECMSERGEVPRDNWNIDCVPMYLKLH